MTFYWGLLALAIATSMVGQTLLKSGAGAPSFLDQMLDWHSLIGLALYGGASLCYMIALRRIPMSVALPCTASSYVVLLLVGHFVFAEPIGMLHVLAILLISAGVALLAFA